MDQVEWDYHHCLREVNGIYWRRCYGNDDDYCFKEWDRAIKRCENARERRKKSIADDPIK
jgi:hypothetical protein